ncbi:MAG: hypothetical protein IJE12_07270 [Prevotella sp.]|nr:hypothetical protein [Prevotella sp.]
MGIVKKWLGRLPVVVGDSWEDGKPYLKKNRVILFGSEFESKEDNNLTPPATYDEEAKTVTFNTEKWRIISNGTDAWLAAQKIDQIEGGFAVE